MSLRQAADLERAGILKTGRPLFLYLDFLQNVEKFPLDFETEIEAPRGKPQGASKPKEVSIFCSSLGRMRSLRVFKSMPKGIYEMKRLLILVLLLAVAGCATLEKGQSEKTYKKKDRHSEHRH